MNSFKAKIDIIGINPFVFLPVRVLKVIFIQAQKEIGPIPVRGTIDGHPFIQTLVKYSGAWRLYINGPMLKVAGKQVGDHTILTIEFDAEERVIPVHPKLEAALKENIAAKDAFDKLTPSRQKEIVRYISLLKTGASVDKNVSRAIDFLLGNERFLGREKH